ncbi:MAG: hypothetical protein M1812_001105 [Candelaria pacifica]|nr:MAG: hypothetical protein M1812_001105 [Candelaria pacifica]
MSALARASLSAVDLLDKELASESKDSVPTLSHVSEPIEGSLQLSQSRTQSSSCLLSSQTTAISLESADSIPDGDPPDLSSWLFSSTISTLSDRPSFDWCTDMHQSSYTATDWQPYHDYYLLSHYWPYLTGSARCRDLHSIDELHMGLARDMNMEVYMDWLEQRLLWVGHRRLLWLKEWIVCRRVMDWLEDVADAVGQADSCILPDSSRCEA